MLWIRIKARLLLLYRVFLLKIGFKKSLLKNRYGEQILVFHGVDTVGDTDINSRFISKEYFERFIHYITSNYNVISLDDYYRKKFKKNTLNIALTFDDGYLNNYEYAIPILKKYKVPASFYITTIHKKSSFLWPDFLDLVSKYSTKKQVVFDGNVYTRNEKKEFTYKGVSLKNTLKTIPYEKIEEMYGVFEDDWKNITSKPLEEYWKLMSFEQLIAIAKDALFTVGSHAKTHANLVAIPLEAAKNEISESKQILEKTLGFPIKEFAFPFGYYTEELANYCLEIGYEKVLLVDYNKNEIEKNEAFKKRFVMNPYISFELQLVSLLKGSYF